MNYRDRSDSSRTRIPIRRRNLGSDVYSVLWERILARDFSGGEKLSDLRLSEELGVSRTPVREALHRLVQDGVVTYSPNRGFSVVSLSTSDVAEIYDLRAALETLALRTAASTIPTREFQVALAELDDIEAQILSATTPDERLAASSAFLDIDTGFHRWIIERSGNQRLIAILFGLWGQVSVFQRAGTHIPGWMEIAIDQHRAILHLLTDNNVEEAVVAMQQHIGYMKQRVIADIAPSLSNSA